MGCGPLMRFSHAATMIMPSSLAPKFPRRIETKGMNLRYPKSVMNDRLHRGTVRVGDEEIAIESRQNDEPLLGAKIV